MLTLITFPPSLGQLSHSSFCVKAMYLLQASGQDWRREDANDPRKMPRAKLPVLRTPTGLVHDSDNIRLYLQENGANFMANLSDLDRARTQALIRMVEEHTYFLLVLDRWGREDVWPTIRDLYFAVIPRIMRGPITSGLRRSLLNGMKAQGLGRLTEDELMTLLNQDLSVITAHLDSSPFLFGEQPTLADYCVAPVLAGLRATPVATPAARRLGEDSLLSSYIERVHHVTMPT